MDLAFTWMRLSFVMFIPAVTFCWMKEVWQRFKNFVLCRKSNLIVDSSPVGSPGHQGKNTKQEVEVEASPGVPVIFATEQGLHFQTYFKRQADAEEPAPDGLQFLEINGSQILTSRKCDIYGSQDFVQIREDEDTSDYDSHGDMDPLSNSNGLSIASGDITNGAFEAETLVKETKSERPKAPEQDEVTTVQRKKRGTRKRDDVEDKRDSDSGMGSLQGRLPAEEQQQKASEESNDGHKEPQDAVAIVKPKRKKKSPLVDTPEGKIEGEAAKPIPAARKSSKPLRKRREQRQFESGPELNSPDNSLRRDVATQCKTKEKYVVGPEMEEN
jgi:hypothetical protein